MPHETKPDPSALLARAREILAWRPCFRELVPAEQAAEIQEQARALAIADSDIGQAAARIGEALAAVTREMSAFLDQWPTDEAAVGAVMEALTAAGLTHRHDRYRVGYTDTHFEHTPHELRTWLPVFQVAEGRLDTCEAIDAATNQAEYDALERTAA